MSDDAKPYTNADLRELREMRDLDHYLGDTDPDRWRATVAALDETRAELAKVKAERDENSERLLERLTAERDAANARVAQLEAALREAVRLGSGHHLVGFNAVELLSRFDGLQIRTAPLRAVLSGQPPPVDYAKHAEALAKALARMKCYARLLGVELPRNWDEMRSTHAALKGETVAAALSGQTKKEGGT